jgi:hypothetical protein
MLPALKNIKFAYSVIPIGAKPPVLSNMMDSNSTGVWLRMVAYATA